VNDSVEKRADTAVVGSLAVFPWQQRGVRMHDLPSRGRDAGLALEIAAGTAAGAGS